MSQVKIYGVREHLQPMESPPHNWGFRGKTGDEVSLNYTLTV